MKQMIYSAVRTQPEQLAVGDYKGFDYYVLSMGTHPCAYIDVTDTDLNGKDLCVIDLECHGGITYAEESLQTVDKKRLVYRLGLCSLWRLYRRPNDVSRRYANGR